MNKKLFYIDIPNSQLKIGLLFFIVKSFLDSSSIISCPKYIDFMLIVSGSICLLVSVFQQKYSYKILAIYGFLGFCALYSYHTTGLSLVLTTTLTCLALRGKVFDRIIEYIFHWEFIFLLIHCLLLVVTLPIKMSDYVILTDVRVRFDFGFLHPNVFSVFVLNLALMWIWINRKWLSDFIIFKTFCLVLFVASLTKTRTLFIAVVCVLILILIVRRMKTRSSVLSQIAKYIFVSVFAVYYLFWTLFSKGNSIVLRVDNLLSGRVRLGAYVMNEYGFSLLGQKIDNKSVHWDSLYKITHFTFDDIYSYLVVNQGALWFVVITICFFLVAKNGDNFTNIYIIIWVLLGITEMHGLDCYSNFIILFASNIFCGSGFPLKVEEYRMCPSVNNSRRAIYG